MTVADCYGQWMPEHVVPERARCTHRNYEGAWRRHLQHRIGAELAIDVRPRHVEALRGEMLSDGLRAQTTRKALQVLDHLFMHALGLDIVEISPVMADPQAAPPRRRRHISVVDVVTAERTRRTALDVEHHARRRAAAS
jgi:hypothetical protein